MEEIQPRWKTIPKEKQEKIKDILFKEYDMKKNFEKQVLLNIKKAREIIYTY